MARAQHRCSICIFFYFANVQVAAWHTIAVGIGIGIRVDTLHEIAGNNGDVVIVKNFDLLITQLLEVKNKICGRSHKF